MEIEEEFNLDKENESETDASVVSKVLQFAKLQLKYLNPNVQQIYFSQELQNDDLKLVELNPSVLKHVENGGKLVIKGNDSENCVMCTDDLTYEVKDTEISNALLLIPGLKSDLPSDKYEGDLKLSKAEVVAVSHAYLELRPIKPKLNRIAELLNQSIYDGPEHEENIANKITMDELLSGVAASSSEIKHAISTMDVVEIDGYIRLIDFDYLSRVIGSITALLEEHSLHSDEFSRKQTLEVLQTIYPTQIIDFVLHAYGAAKSESSTDIWSLDEDKVCRYFAEMLMKPTQQFNLNEFLEAWKESVPEGMVTSLKQISGMAIIDTKSEPAVIRYFPVEALSEDVKTRFEELFAVKDSWTLEEITPYIAPLCIGKLTVSVLVMKNARAVTKGGVKYYTPKYIKN